MASPEGDLHYGALLEQTHPCEGAKPSQGLLHLSLGSVPDRKVRLLKKAYKDSEF